MDAFEIAYLCFLLCVVGFVIGVLITIWIMK